MEEFIMSEEFTYTYSAADSSEAEKIRQKYVQKTEEENTMETLRKLDASAEAAGRIVSMTIGIISTLLLGVGMCCTMVWTDLFVLGIIVGIAGIAGCIAAPFVNSRITRAQREKIAPQIMKLSDEII